MPLHSSSASVLGDREKEGWRDRRACARRASYLWPGKRAVMSASAAAEAEVGL